MSNALTTKTSTFDLSPQTFDQALTFSQYLADSDMVPKDYKGKPGNCLIAMQWGAEVGLKPLQALQNLADMTEITLTVEREGQRHDIAFALGDE